MYRITIDKSISIPRTKSTVMARNDYGEATKICTFNYQDKDYQVIYKQIFEFINIPDLIKCINETSNSNK